LCDFLCNETRGKFVALQLYGPFLVRDKLIHPSCFDIKCAGGGGDDDNDDDEAKELNM
jgi:hypothetical protein